MEYRRFATRVESSLINVVTPNELTMQKYWQAQHAVTKLRHEAMISAMESAIEASARSLVSEIIQGFSDRLDKIERSSSSTSVVLSNISGSGQPLSSLSP